MSTSKFASNIGAVAALITAVGGLIIALNQIGVLPGGDTSEQAIENPRTERLEELENRIKDLSKEEIKQREEELLDKIEELENQVSDDSNGGFSGGGTNYNLTGNWSDQNMGGSYSIYQNGNAVSFLEYSNVYGIRTATAEGTGTIQNNTLTINYTTIYYTSGVATFQIQGGGFTLSGSFRDLNSGVTMNMTLYKN